MTPEEQHELQYFADEIRQEAKATGRNVREILDAMRDEGYIDCTDEYLEQCAKLAEAPLVPSEHRGGGDVV